MINHLKDIVAASCRKGRRRLVVACAADLHTLQSAADAVEAGLVEAVLTGQRAEIERVCREGEIDPTRFRIVEVEGDEACVEMAVRMVRSGEGDLLMKGIVSSDRYVRGILNREWGLLPEGGILSHVSVFELPVYHKLLVISDPAVISLPDLRQKIAIVRYLASVAGLLGVERPKVACLAPSEQVLPSIVSSTDAAILSKMSERGQLGNVWVDGPLALDVALFEEVARTKKLQGSRVAGDADCLLFPSIDAANVFFKSMTKVCGAEVAGMLAGTTKPCVMTSRGDSRAAKFHSIALAALTAGRNL